MGYLFTYPFLKTITTIGIALVWLINGLFCKVMNLVPRHQLIVATILGSRHATAFTRMIGISEIVMAVWILSNMLPHLCAVVQIIVVATMNIIEFIKVPHLLLFGRMNILVSIFFMAVVYVNACIFS